MTFTISNHFKYMLATKKVDLAADTIKAICMDSDFVFDKDADATLALVTGDQIATGNGYTQDAKTLANVSVAEDDATDKAVLTCDDVSWTASGGAIGPVSAVVLYDDTTTDDTVIGAIEFGTTYTIADGASLVVEDLKISVS